MITFKIYCLSNFLFKNKFIFGYAGSLLLHKLFSNYSKLGLLPSCIVQASHCGDYSSQSTGSGVVAHGLSCSVARGIFPDQGLNHCLLHWQVHSLLLSHQGSPSNFQICTTVLLTIVTILYITSHDLFLL